MTDIVEDLREYTRKIMVPRDPPRNYLPWRAADEIERLRAIAENVEALRRNLEDVSCRQQNEIERLRAAHQRIIDMESATQEMTVANLMAAESRAALKEPKP